MGTCCASSRKSRDYAELEKLVDSQALQELTEDDLDSKEVEEHWRTIMHHFVPKSREFVIYAYCHNIETSLNLFIPNPVINIILLYVQVVSLETLIQARRASIKQDVRPSDNLFTIEKAIFRILSTNESSMSNNASNNENLIEDILQNYKCKKLSDFNVWFNDEIIYKSDAAEYANDDSADRIEDKQKLFFRQLQEPIEDKYDKNSEAFETQRRAFADIAMEHKNEEILVTIVKICSRNKQLQFKGDYLQEILDFTASNTMYSLCNLLMQSQVFKQIEFTHRPQCLLNAFHSRDHRIISCIINGLKSKKEFFCLCNDVFEIEYMDCAEDVVKYGWFIPSAGVYERAVTEKNEIVLVMIAMHKQYWQNGTSGHGHETNFYLSGRNLRNMLCLASTNKMYHLAKILMKDYVLHQIKFNPRPECLLIAVQNSDYKMISIILDGLKRKTKYSFVCDDVFKECIVIDHFECAKCIVEQHWYSPTEKETVLAQQYSKAIYTWLLKRSVGCLFEKTDNIGFDDWVTENSNDDWNIEDDNRD